MKSTVSTAGGAQTGNVYFLKNSEGWEELIIYSC
jgi:hypothetical protein